MARKVAMAVVSGLVMVAAVFANAGPARLPKDRKVAEPVVRFEGLDQCPDHVFYLYYGAVYFGYTWAEVKGSEPIKLNFKTKEHTPSAYLQLYAMERKAFEKRKKEDPSLKWLYGAKDGVLTAELDPPETTIPATAKESPMTTYRVTLGDGKLRGEKVTENKCGAAGPFGLLPPFTVGIVSSVSIAWLGIWFARRSAATTSRERGAAAHRPGD
jgi:hypothetical protein